MSEAWKQRAALAFLTDGQCWFHTRGPDAWRDVVLGLPPVYITTRYSSIGELSEKVHVAITEAGLAALAASKEPESTAKPGGAPRRVGS